MNYYFAKLLFCIVISVISGAFYGQKLWGEYRRRGRVIFMSVLIFLTYLVMYFPVYLKWERVFDIFQILGEFLILCIFAEGSILKKLTVYLEMNIIMGIGMAGGYSILKIIKHDTENILSQKSFENQVTYYIAVVLIVFILCFAVSNYNKEREELGNIGGTELSVCVVMGLLCMSYAIGIRVTEAEESMETLFLYGVFGIMIIMIIVLLNINRYICHRENLNIKYYVLKKQEYGSKELMEQLRRDSEYFQWCADTMEKKIKEMYNGIELKEADSGRKNCYCTNAVINAVLAEKVQKACSFGCDIGIKMEASESTCIEPMDCVSIIANLIDNAIEAAAKNEVSNRYIKVVGRADGSQFKLTVENTYNGNLLSDGEILYTTKKDGEGHGLGVANVRGIVSRYGKSMTIKAEDGVFTVNIR